jgi:hypothetical protein
MDPYVQAALTALLSGAAVLAVFFWVVPRLAADPPRREAPPKAAE